MGLFDFTFIAESYSSDSNWGSLADWLGVIVSAIAVYLAWKAFRQAEITARGDKRPHLICSINNEIGIDLSVIIKNIGVGPALIQKVVFGHGESADKTTNNLDFLVPLEFQTKVGRLRLTGGKTLGLMPGEYYEILTAHAKDFSSFDEFLFVQKEVNSKWKQTRFDIYYESIFGDKFTATEPRK